MSLKSFHIFFIALASLMCFGFGAWCLIEASGQFVPFGAAAIIGGLALIAYGVNFLRKFRDVSFL